MLFDETVKEIFKPGATILDIGSGLRVDGSRGNVVDKSRTWIKPLLESVTYHVLDPVDTYHPDIVGDVMNMHQIQDASYDAVICMAVLEHVPRPCDAAREMQRVLRPHGRLLAYVPFLSPYHAMPGYYGDFFRYTDDGIRSLFGTENGWDDLKIEPVRGPVETLTHLLPGRLHALGALGRGIDRMRNSTGKQVSGFNFTATKSV